MNYKRHKKRDRLTGDADRHEWRRAARDRRIARQPQVHEPLAEPEPIYDVDDFDLGDFFSDDYDDGWGYDPTFCPCCGRSR